MHKISLYEEIDPSINDTTNPNTDASDFIYVPHLPRANINPDFYSSSHGRLFILSLNNIFKFFSKYIL
jgi:hypothetical protein